MKWSVGASNSEVEWAIDIFYEYKLKINNLTHTKRPYIQNESKIKDGMLLGYFPYYLVWY